MRAMRWVVASLVILLLVVVVAVAYAVDRTGYGITEGTNPCEDRYGDNYTYELGDCVKK